MSFGLAVMSWTWRGSTSEAQIGRPPGEHDNLDIPAGAVVLAGVPGVDRPAFHAGHLLCEAVRAEQLPVENHEGGSLFAGSLQGLVQVRRLGGEDLGAVESPG